MASRPETWTKKVDLAAYGVTAMRSFFLKEFKEAVLKQKIGFLVLKLGEKEEGRYLYPTVLYHLALRSRIKRELETGKVLRCCCREDEAEVTINENLELQFLRGRHAAACVEYVRQLAKYSKAAGVIPFIYGRGFSIPVAFKVQKKGPERKQAYTLEKRLTCASGSDLI